MSVWLVPLPAVCMTVPHRLKKMAIPTPHREVSLQRADLVHKHTLVAWGSSGMLVKINLFHPFLAIVKTNWGSSDTAGTPPSHFLNSPSFFMALDSQVSENIEMKSIFRSGLHLAEEIYWKIFLKSILLEKTGRFGISPTSTVRTRGFWPKEQFQRMKCKLKNYTKSGYEQNSGIHLIAFLSSSHCFHSLLSI